MPNDLSVKEKLPLNDDELYLFDFIITGWMNAWGYFAHTKSYRVMEMFGIVQYAVDNAELNCNEVDLSDKLELFQQFKEEFKATPDPAYQADIAVNVLDILFTTNPFSVAVRKASEQILEEGETV